MKNEIIFVDGTKDKCWEEMKPRMLLMVDGQVMVTGSLTACRSGSCVFRHIMLLVMYQKAVKAVVFWG